MKSITAHAILLGFFFNLLIGFFTEKADAGEYYIYRDSTGVLVISNQKPPPGSEILEQHNSPVSVDSETPPLTDGNDKRLNKDSNSSNPATNK